MIPFTDIYPNGYYVWNENGDIETSECRNSDSLTQKMEVVASIIVIILSLIMLVMWGLVFSERGFDEWIKQVLRVVALSFLQ